ncbi:2671_t:CDS:2, partial [Racocetra persica]
DDESSGQMKLEILITISSLIDKLNEISTDKTNPNLLAIELVKLCEKNDGYSYLNHMLLHPRPQHINVTDEIKDYIKANQKHSASELYKQIIIEKIKGYELLTVNQTYYWWA